MERGVFLSNKASASKRAALHLTIKVWTLEIGHVALKRAAWSVRVWLEARKI